MLFDFACAPRRLQRCGPRKRQNRATIQDVAVTEMTYRLLSDGHSIAAARWRTRKAIAGLHQLCILKMLLPTAEVFSKRDVFELIEDENGLFAASDDARVVLGVGRSDMKY